MPVLMVMNVTILLPVNINWKIKKIIEPAEGETIENVFGKC